MASASLRRQLLRAVRAGPGHMESFAEGRTRTSWEPLRSVRSRTRLRPPRTAPRLATCPTWSSRTQTLRPRAPHSQTEAEAEVEVEVAAEGEAGTKSRAADVAVAAADERRSAPESWGSASLARTFFQFHLHLHYHRSLQSATRTRTPTRSSANRAPSSACARRRRSQPVRAHCCRCRCSTSACPFPKERGHPEDSPHPVRARPQSPSCVSSGASFRVLCSGQRSTQCTVLYKR